MAASSLKLVEWKPYEEQMPAMGVVNKIMGQLLDSAGASSPSVAKSCPEWNYEPGSCQEEVSPALSVCRWDPLRGATTQPCKQANVEVASEKNTILVVSPMTETANPQLRCSLLQLEATLVCALWPPERVVMGVRVCKTFRHALMMGPGTALLKETSNAANTEDLRCESLLGVRGNKVVEQAQAGLRLFKHWSIQLQLLPNGKSSFKKKTDAVLKQFDRTGLASRLTTLQLGSTDLQETRVIMPVLAPVLHAAQSLKFLQLSNLRFEPTTSGLLEEALSNCILLEHLDLAACRMCDPAAFALGNALRNCLLLRYANLSANRFSSTGAKALIEGLGQSLRLTHLNISNNRNIRNTWHEFGTFQGRALEDVNFAGCKVGPFLVSQLAGVLAECPKLTALNLTNTEMGDEGVESLIPVLKQCPAFKRLQMGHNNLSPDGMRHLQRALTGHRVAGNEARDLAIESRDEGHDHPRPSTTVRMDVPKLGLQLAEINVYGNFLTEHGARRLGELLGHFGVLQRLILGCNDLAEQGAAALAPYLPTCATLQHLDVYGNRLEEKGFTAIVGAVNLCTALTSLHVGGNMIAITEPCGLESSSLKVLHLRNNAIDSGGASRLEEIIRSKRLPALTALHLGRNDIGDTGCQGLAGVLTELNALRLLDLSNNSISSAGARSVGQALLVPGAGLSSSLTHLNLADNDIAPSAARPEEFWSLVQGLKRTTRSPSSVLCNPWVVVGADEIERRLVNTALGVDDNPQNVWQRRAPPSRTLEPPPPATVLPTVDPTEVDDARHSGVQVEVS